MRPSVVTVRDMIRHVAMKWALQYQCSKSERDRTIWQALDKLDPETATTKDVAEIIGNDSWTRLQCNGCKRSVDVIVQVGDEPDYESATANLCRSCVEEALEAIKKVEGIK